MVKKELIIKSLKVLHPFDLYFLIISTIVIIPFIYTKATADPNMAGRLLALGIVVLVFAFLNIVKPKNKRPEFSFLKLSIFPVFFVYFLWMIVTATQAVNWAEGMYDITKTALSLLLLVFATQIFIDNKNAFPFLAKTILIASVFATALGLYQYYGNVPGKSGHDLFMALYKVKGLMAHKNQFAISLMLMLPFAVFGILRFRKWWWGLSVYSTLLILANIFLAQSRSVWVATAVFVLSFGFLWSMFFLKDRLKTKKGILKKMLITVLLIIILGMIGFFEFQKTEAFATMKYRFSSLFDAKSHDNQGRLRMWEATWDLAIDNKVFGVGAGNWRIAVLPYYDTSHGANYQNWRRPHNDFLWVFSEKGIVGVVLYFLMFLIIGYYGLRILTKETDKDKKLIGLLLISGIGTYFITAQFSFPLERINHQIYLMIMMAGLISIYYQKPKSSQAVKGRSYYGMLLISIVLSVFTIYYSILMIRSEIQLKKIYVAMSANDQGLVILHAKKAYTIFTTVDHFAIPIYSYMGTANLKMRNYEQANNDFQIALKHFPTNVLVLSYLAIVSAEMHDNQQAISYLEQSLDLYPHYDASLHNLVNIYYLKKDFAQAYLTLLHANTRDKLEDYDGNMRVLKKLVDKPVD